MAANVIADVRYSLRSLARTPVWTAALVLTIGLGIGSNASVQGFVRGLLTTDLPIYAIERVVTVFATDETGASGPVPFELFGALNTRRDIFESVGAIHESQERVSIGPRSTLMSVGTYTPDIAAVFPFPSHAGVTLSHRVRFAQYPASVEPSGGVLQIDGATMRITGAMPYWLEGLYRGRTIDLWRPLDGRDAGGEQGQAWVVGRLRPGVSVRKAQAAIDEIGTTDTAISVLPVQRTDSRNGERHAARRRVAAARRRFRISDGVRECRGFRVGTLMGARSRDSGARRDWRAAPPTAAAVVDR